MHFQKNKKHELLLFYYRNKTNDHASIAIIVFFLLLYIKVAAIPLYMHMVMLVYFSTATELPFSWEQADAEDVEFL